MKNQDKKGKQDPEAKMEVLKTDANPAMIQQGRMANLATGITKLINVESNKETPLSIFEVTEVLLKVAFSFNKRFLNQDHQNMVNAKLNENQSKN